MSTDLQAPVTVAALQMTSAADRDANLATAARLLERAAAAGSRVAVLPENFSFMGVRDGDRRAQGEPDGDGPVQRFLAERARALRLWIVGGTAPIARESGGRVAAACLVYDDAGRRVARYDKIHLFDVDVPGRNERYRESNHIEAGRTPVVVDTPAGRLGLSVCYDIRFPELFRAMVAQGAEWFTVPAAFTVPTGKAHWEALLRARAIENLAWVVASGQWGTHANGRETYGHSLIADHWGEVRACLPAGEGIVTAAIDRAAQAATRQSFPALQHRVLP
ncbi:MAG: carbon-nitrogen hydrolase family protein [Steroidobacteraceae bacterium]